MPGFCFWEPECPNEGGPNAIKSRFHLAQMLDTMIVLNDVGTGLTNGFIRYGWEPPTYPKYGFFC
jgi:hypothetical protein